MSDLKPKWEDRPFADWVGDMVSLRPGFKKNAVTALPFKQWTVLPDSHRAALFIAIPLGRKAMRRVLCTLGIRRPWHLRTPKKTARFLRESDR